ncbi:MAG: hypothetical protein M3527_00225 [Actinomycetota bacterium]|nr:hypothetical protein [Acidimicrobiia bacterium]MDQ3292868.1 hypothetical protein [Actinomycetota bacterium]
MDETEPEAAPWWSPRRRVLAIVAVAAVVVATVAIVERVDRGPPDPPPGSWTMVVHRGLGAWVDDYDWTVELGGAEPLVDEDDIEAMAAAGVQTVYVQTSHNRSASDVMEPERLDGLLDAAHAHGMHVVAWYLPTLTDVDDDLRRLEAAAELRVDGLAVDIETTAVEDVAERNRRLLDLSERLRAAVPAERPIGAITLSAVHIQVVNPAFWPEYPWAELAATYDVIMPMAYWSIRRGELQEGGRYVGENIERIRASTGDPDIPIHVVGGIADGVTDADLTAMVAAIEDGGAIGGSLYDWVTSEPEHWSTLGTLMALRAG